MSGLIDAISVVGSAVGIISWAQGLFPSQPREGASVSIRTSNGYDSSSGEIGNTNTGGQIRNVYGYDAGNVLLGSSGGGHINPGAERTFKINQGNNVQALYVDVVADDDAVCIPVISVTQADEGLNFAWSGDVFTACGLDNYYGNVVAGSKNGNDRYMPRCGWIDANHDNIGQASFKWYLPAFSHSRGSDFNTDPDFYCHPRPLEVRYDAQPIEKRTPAERRALRRANLPFNELVISPHAQHPASELCEDETTVGSDFVSLAEGTFCDMGSKKWYALCDEKAGLLDNCYALNMANKTMSASFAPKLVDTLVQTLYSYDHVTTWH